MTKKIIVQKFGGATLADSDKIKQVAIRIFEQSKENLIIAVVSAMGKTTNQLIELANQVSKNPQRRELDMLLSTGERVSMSLVSMALNDLGANAISFTGSQAGILTNDSHVNAQIIDVNSPRVKEALAQDKIVILAGFQGVSPITKEITTLGRGGSDTSAVAMAAASQAERCEILKDVAGVYTADPKLVKTATPLKQLNYDQLMEMTFWGAKVLHYRSVELAKTRSVTLYIGPAENKESEGTWVQKDLNMFESSKVLAINSHEEVLQINSKYKDYKAILELNHLLEHNQIAFPQLLNFEVQAHSTTLFLTGPSEILNQIKHTFKNNDYFELNSQLFSTVTLTCTGITDPQITVNACQILKENNIDYSRIWQSTMSMSFLIAQENKNKTISILHRLIK